MATMRIGASPSSAVSPCRRSSDSSSASWRLSHGEHERPRDRVLLEEPPEDGAGQLGPLLRSPRERARQRAVRELEAEQPPDERRHLRDAAIAEHVLELGSKPEQRRLPCTRSIEAETLAQQAGDQRPTRRRAAGDGRRRRSGADHPECAPRPLPAATRPRAGSYRTRAGPRPSPSAAPCTAALVRTPRPGRPTPPPARRTPPDPSPCPYLAPRGNRVQRQSPAAHMSMMTTPRSLSSGSSSGSSWCSGFQRSSRAGMSSRGRSWRRRSSSSRRRICSMIQGSSTTTRP